MASRHLWANCGILGCLNKKKKTHLVLAAKRLPLLHLSRVHLKPRSLLTIYIPDWGPIVIWTTWQCYYNRVLISVWKVLLKLGKFVMYYTSITLKSLLTITHRAVCCRMNVMDHFLRPSRLKLYSASIRYEKLLTSLKLNLTNDMAMGARAYRSFVRARQDGRSCAITSSKQTSQM